MADGIARMGFWVYRFKVGSMQAPTAKASTKSGLSCFEPVHLVCLTLLDHAFSFVCANRVCGVGTCVSRWAPCTEAAERRGWQ